MKTELIEYHRKRRNKAASIRIAGFHERAVAWLEGLIEDDEAMYIAAHMKGHPLNKLNERDASAPQQCAMQKG